MEIILKELKKVAVTVGIIAVLTLLVGLFCGAGFLSMLVSLLFGGLFTLANFYLLGSLCQKACTKTPERAKRYMQLNYAARLILVAIVIVAAFKLSYLNPAGVILPLFAPKLTYFATAVYETLHKKKPAQ